MLNTFEMYIFRKKTSNKRVIKGNFYYYIVSGLNTQQLLFNCIVCALRCVALRCKNFVFAQQSFCNATQRTTKINNCNKIPKIIYTDAKAPLSQSLFFFYLYLLLDKRIEKNV